MATIAQPLTDQSNAPKQAPLTLSDGAIAKVREIMATQDPLPAGLRIGVVGKRDRPIEHVRQRNRGRPQQWRRHEGQQEQAAEAGQREEQPVAHVLHVRSARSASP